MNITTSGGCQARCTGTMALVVSTTSASSQADRLSKQLPDFEPEVSPAEYNFHFNAIMYANHSFAAMTSSMGKMWDEVPYQPIATSTIQYISRVLHTSSTALPESFPSIINLQYLSKSANFPFVKIGYQAHVMSNQNVRTIKKHLHEPDPWP